MRCTVFSYPAALSTTFEDAAFAADVNPESKEYSFARCQKSEELHVVLNNIRKNIKVTCLDIFAHGDSGELKLGDTPLISPKATSWDVIDELNWILDKNGKVRLLGCFTATCKEGLDVLRELSGRLENREVFGTRTMIYQWDFGGTGFDESATKYLTSSVQLNRGNTHIDPEPRPASAGLSTPSEDLFIRQIQDQYESLGRMDAPAAVINAEKSFKEEKIHIAIACKGKLLLIHDEAQKKPMVFMRKQRCGAPNVKDLKELFDFY